MFYPEIPAVRESIAQIALPFQSPLKNWKANVVHCGRASSLYLSSRFVKSWCTFDLMTFDLQRFKLTPGPDGIGSSCHLCALEPCAAVPLFLELSPVRLFLN